MRRDNLRKSLQEHSEKAHSRHYLLTKDEKKELAKLEGIAEKLKRREKLGKPSTANLAK